MEQQQIEQVFEVEETTLYVWRTKVARLAMLHDLGLLNEEQQMHFAELIWSRVDEQTQMPDLPNRYLWTYMKLPCNKENALAISVKACLLKEGLMKTLGAEQGYRFTMGEIRYLDELNAMARALEKDFFSVKDVEDIFCDAMAYWKVLKQKFAIAKHDDMKFEFNSRVRKIVRTLTTVYSSISETVGEEIHLSMQEMLAEMKEFGINELQLEILFENSDLILVQIEDKLYSSDIEGAVDAIIASNNYISKCPATQQAQYILRILIQLLCTRKSQGLLSIIYVLHNLIYSNCSIMTDAIIAEIDKALLEMERFTCYERHMESNKAVKEAVALRKACSALAYQIYRKKSSCVGEGVLLWKTVAEGDEFTQVRNEWY